MAKINVTHKLQLMLINHHCRFTGQPVPSSENCHWIRLVNLQTAMSTWNWL